MPPNPSAHDGSAARRARSGLRYRALNAGTALYAAGVASSIEDGLKRAREAITPARRCARSINSSKSRSCSAGELTMFGIHDLTLFIISGLLLNIMPGPDNLLIMTRSATQGWRAGSAAALGIGTGTMVHMLAAALGLSAVLSTSAAAFTVVKWVGAAYIVYMGIGMLRAKLRNEERGSWRRCSRWPGARSSSRAS
jgi:hypothetical protein